MTISTSLNKISYQGNGSNTSWSFTFPAGPNPDIKVFVSIGTNPTVQITTNIQINVNPEIAPNPTSMGGTVVYPVSGAPLGVGDRITIIRQVPLIQPTSFTNQGTIYQEVIEETFDYVVEEIQQLQEQINRGVLAPITDTTPITIPPCPERANKFLAFDENCNAIVVGNANPITSTNGIRVPNTEIIPELGARALRPGTIITFNGNGDPILAALPPPNLQALLGTRVTLTGTHTALNTEKGFLFQLAGNSFYDFSLGPPTDYDGDFSVAIFNADIYTGPGTGRAKRVLFDGTVMPGGLLWPGQWIYVFRYGTTWVSNPPDQRWKPGVQITFFVDPVSGADDGTADGLATGTGAAKTVAFAVNVANSRVDFGGLAGLSTGGVIQLAQGTYTEIITVDHPTVGGTPLTIKGANDGVDPSPWLIQVAADTTGITVTQSSVLLVKGISFVGLGANAIGMRALNGSTMTVNNCKMGNFPGGIAMHFNAFENSVLELRDITIAGNAAAYVLITARQSVARLFGAMNVGNGLTFGCFFAAHNLAAVLGGQPLSGGIGGTDFHIVGGAGCAGVKFQAFTNSLISVGFNCDLLPGNAAGAAGVGVVRGNQDSSLVF